ncbi:MAG: efflux RND transporter permease subunit [Candidatus Competibacteraceae bacterium]|nr:efflux RND transporter permease subunit [Candidatus Competibacteraceae bacterium]
MKGVIASFTRHTVFANIVLVLIFVAGGMAMKNMVRETFPEFSLDIITVSVPWPGADPEEVEEGICRKIEEAIDGVEGIRRYSSTSAENMGTVLVEVREDYDVSAVKDRVRNKVDAISSFPLDAEKPITEEITLRQNVLVIALTGDNLSEKTLKEWAEQVKDEVRLLPSISQAQVLGGRDYEISIEVSEVAAARVWADLCPGGLGGARQQPESRRGHHAHRGRRNPPSHAGPQIHRQGVFRDCLAGTARRRDHYARPDCQDSRFLHRRPDHLAVQWPSIHQRGRPENAGRRHRRHRCGGT